MKVYAKIVSFMVTICLFVGHVQRMNADECNSCGAIAAQHKVMLGRNSNTYTPGHVNEHKKTKKHEQTFHERRRIKKNKQHKKIIKNAQENNSQPLRDVNELHASTSSASSENEGQAWYANE